MATFNFRPAIKPSVKVAATKTVQPIKPVNKKDDLYSYLLSHPTGELAKKFYILCEAGDDSEDLRRDLYFLTSINI